MIVCLILFFSSLCSFVSADEYLLKNNLKAASAGDYVVTMQGKSLTLLHIFGRSESQLIIEEVTIPKIRAKQYVLSWRNWFEQGAPGHSSWVIYQINTDSGEIQSCYSFTRGGWYSIPESENFLGKLLNLQLYQMPQENRRKIASGNRNWQPQMVVEGELIQGVPFEVYTTFWPKDGSQLSGKKIEIFLPAVEGPYPSYFPYWLQISGLIGKAKIRVIDSGSHLKSPKSGFPTESY